MDEGKRDQGADATYETPAIVASLDALDMIADADGTGVINKGSGTPA
jgi:hypothetical protein